MSVFLGQNSEKSPNPPNLETMPSLEKRTENNSVNLRGGWVGGGGLEGSNVMTSISSTHSSRDVVFSGQNLAKKTAEIISVHDVWGPLKQALLASRDVMISSQICVSKLQRFFTVGDGCWLPNLLPSYSRIRSIAVSLPFPSGVPRSASIERVHLCAA